MGLLAWTFAVATLISSPSPRFQEARLAELVGEVRSADYRGDGAALARLDSILGELDGGAPADYREYSSRLRGGGGNGGSRMALRPRHSAAADRGAAGGAEVTSRRTRERGRACACRGTGSAMRIAGERWAVAGRSVAGTRRRDLSLTLLLHSWLSGAALALPMAAERVHNGGWSRRSVAPGVELSRRWSRSDRLRRHPGQIL
jgi:hypothetical protein